MRTLIRAILVTAITAQFGLGLFDSPEVFAQPAGKPKAESRTLTADDGWPIHITYYESADGQESPVVVLLHNEGSNRLVWQGKNGVAERLQNRGFAVITVDLRKHGESKDPPETTSANSGGKPSKSADSTNLRPVDYQRMATNDLAAVKDFIFQEHQNKKLNMRKTGIVAPEMSAPIALVFAATDWLKKPYDDAPTLAARTPRGQDVRAIVLLSPDENVSGVRSGRALLALRNPGFRIALMTQYGDSDRQNRGNVARKMHEKVSNHPDNKDRTYLQAYKAKLRGTDLLQKGLKVEDHIVGFFDKHLKELNGESDKWRDRRSALNR